MTKTGLSETREELLTKLINRKTPRAMVGRNCVYDHAVHGGCAIGVELRKSIAAECGRRPIDRVQHKLPNRLVRLGINFLTDVQNIHDLGANWKSCFEEGELVWNTNGIDKINKVIDHYELNLTKLPEEN